MNTGFIEPKIETSGPKAHYVLGGGNVPKIVLRPSGDWSDIPDKEVQNRRFETNNCTAFNTLSRVEKMVFVIDGVKVNYSDRFLGVVAGTYPPGNDPHLVAEAIRKYGCIPEEMMPFSDDLANVDEYYSWKGVDKEACLAEGRKWLEKWEFMHEWVFLPGDPKSIRIPSMVEALTLCPPAVAVYAWEKDGRGLYVDKGRQPNHWTGLDNDMPLEHWLVGDSYIADDSEHKKLDWFFNFEYCKRFHLRRREAVVDTRNALIQFAINLANKIVALLTRQVAELPIPPAPQPLPEPQKPPVVAKSSREKLYEAALSFIGKEASPKDIAPDELACAESFCNVVRKVYPDFPMITYTPTLLAHLKKDKRFKATLEAKPGVVIISPTASSTRVGHVGIFLDGKIASNTSAGPDKGKWTANFTLKTWISRYRTKFGLGIYYFEPV